jgi:FAD/FMN-containing dehydrogenase
MAVDDAAHRASQERLLALNDALAPYDTGRRYLNFTDQRTDPARFFAPTAYGRLRAIKAATDPDGLFRANHPLPPAS